MHSYRQQLQNFKERTGHFRVPSTERSPKKARTSVGEEEGGDGAAPGGGGEGTPTRAAEDPETIQLGKWLKRQRRLYSTSQLPANRVAALQAIGFDFQAGHMTKGEKLKIQLGLLDQLRRSRELTQAQVEDLNGLYDEWKRRGTERLGRNGKGYSADPSNKFNIKWAQNCECRLSVS